MKRLNFGDPRDRKAFDDTLQLALQYSRACSTSLAVQLLMDLNRHLLEWSTSPREPFWAYIARLDNGELAFVWHDGPEDDLQDVLCRVAPYLGVIMMMEMAVHVRENTLIAHKNRHGKNYPDPSSIMPLTALKCGHPYSHAMMPITAGGAPGMCRSCLGGGFVKAAGLLPVLEVRDRRRHARGTMAP